MAAQPAIRWMGLAGILGGVSWIVLQIALGGDWGEPGTNAYVRYEFFNRLWSLPLLLMAFGFVGVDGLQRQQRPYFGTRPLRIIRVGFLAMLVGNIAEFWFFTDYPYGEMNLRAYAWLTFLLGMLITLFGLTWLGRSTLRAAILPKWSGIVLLLALPVEITVFFIGQRILFVTASIAIILGGLIFLQSQKIPQLSTRPEA